MTQSASQIKLCVMKQIFESINLYLKYVCVPEDYQPPKPRFNISYAWIKYLKPLYYLKCLYNIVTEFWTKPKVEMNGFDQFRIALYIVYEYLYIV